MHVAVDARLAYYTSGGIARYTLALAAAMATHSPDVHFTLLRSVRQFRKSVPRARNLGSVPLITPPHHRWEQFTLPLEICRVRADLLHSPDFIPPIRRPCPAVITVHDLGFLHFPETLTGESRRYYGQIGDALKSAERIIAVSHSTARDMADRFGRNDRVRVVHNGVGAEFRPASDAVVSATRAQYGLSRPYLLHVGTLEPRKNLGTLLRAFRIVCARHAVSLLLVGRRGWLYEPIFAEATRLGLADKVRVIENVSDRDLPAIYTGASAFAYPSLYEGFGLPALEAMACGTPAVVADTSSLPEVVGDAALLHRPADHQALAEALFRLLEDEELRATLRRRGLARAASFTWQDAADKTLAIYREALNA